MWKGTAEILKANPTNMNTIANIAPLFSLFNWSAINSKFVDPVNPYNNEQPYNNNPEDNALNTKYLIPDYEDFRLSLSIDASIYNASDWSSNPR